MASSSASSAGVSLRGVSQSSKKRALTLGFTSESDAMPQCAKPYPVRLTCANGQAEVDFRLANDGARDGARGGRCSFFALISRLVRAGAGRSPASGASWLAIAFDGIPREKDQLDALGIKLGLGGGQSSDMITLVEVS